MAQIINTPIPDAKTPWENYSGEQVEKFLKEQLAALGSRIDGVDLAKGSYLALLNVDEASSMASVGIFAVVSITCARVGVPLPRCPTTSSFHNFLMPSK